MNIIDKSLAIAKAGGSIELARELFLILQDELRTALLDLHSAEARDSDIVKLAHKLRSSARYCAAPGLESAAEKCEHATRHENFAELKSELASAIEQILAMNNPY